jgi:hypothetical protein
LPEVEYQRCCTLGHVSCIVTEKGERRSSAVCSLTSNAFTKWHTEAEHDSVAWLQKVPSLKALKVGTPTLDIDARQPVADKEHVILKKNASAFYGTGLDVGMPSKESKRLIADLKVPADVDAIAPLVVAQI